jgi:hypothetical protein
LASVTLRNVSRNRRPICADPCLMRDSAPLRLLNAKTGQAPGVIGASDGTREGKVAIRLGL